MKLTSSCIRNNR